MFYPYFHIFICQCMAKKYIYERLAWSSHNFKPLRMCSIPSKAKNSKFFLAFSDQTEKSEVP